MSFKTRFHMIYSPILAFILGIGIMAYVMGDNRAEVVFSNTTGECLRVVEEKGTYSCDNLPPRYKKLWVN